MFRNLTNEEMLEMLQGKIEPKYKVVYLSNGELCTDKVPTASRFEVGKVTISPSKLGFGVMRDLTTARNYLNNRKAYLEHSGMAIIKIFPLVEVVRNDEKDFYTEVFTADVIERIPENKNFVTPAGVDVTSECQYVLFENKISSKSGFALQIVHRGKILGYLGNEGIDLTISHGYKVETGNDMEIHSNSIMFIPTFRIIKE